MTDQAENKKQMPISILCIGMAGSGKTTFMQRINSHLRQNGSIPYVINLDPAVANLSYPANIDIRDTVNYHQVMEQYKLGPNGGILTSLNLFTTKFDQVLDMIAAKSDIAKYAIIDTPGQIEIFTWSASGAIITEALASQGPTVVAYIIDTPRTTSPSTFMSNMLYACSILYKTKLPFILVFNKVDVVDHQFAVDWMTDFESFQQALTTDESYMSSYMNSMCLVLDEFYNHLNVVGCSAATGQGIDEFFKAVQAAADEYENEYRPELEKKIQEKKNNEQIKKQEQIENLLKDLKIEEQGNEVKIQGFNDDNEEEVEFME